ncbi:glycosyltransferase 87 family protein [Streptomyces stramineus]
MPGVTGRTGPGPYASHRMAAVAALLLVTLLLLMAVRLPWAGDLGMHAAVLERLRADPAHPGNPLVDADTPSPYYSPWTVLLALLASATGLGTFTVLRLAALAALVLLVTGVRAFVRTLTPGRAAVPLALLCLLLLYGTRLFAWSGFPGLTSLSLTLAYPSAFACGLAFHLWALLRGALAAGRGLPAFLGLGLLLAGVLLSHQYTGAVAALGAAGVLLGARPWPARAVLIRVGAGAVLAVAVLACWPYYSFFSLLGTDGLDDIHRPLYDHLGTKFCLALLGIAALAARWWRDRRDPLVLFFALGAAVFAAGGLSGHHSWGRILPAVLLPAQLALAVETAEATGGGGGSPADGRGPARRGVDPGRSAHVRAAPGGDPARPAARAHDRALAAVRTGGARGAQGGDGDDGRLLRAADDPRLRALHRRPRLPRHLPARRTAGAATPPAATSPPPPPGPNGSRSSGSTACAGSCRNRAGPVCRRTTPRSAGPCGPPAGSPSRRWPSDERARRPRPVAARPGPWPVLAVAPLWGALYVVKVLSGSRAAIDNAVVVRAARTLLEGGSPYADKRFLYLPGAVFAAVPQAPVPDRVLFYAVPVVTAALVLVGVVLALRIFGVRADSRLAAAMTAGLGLFLPFYGIVHLGNWTVLSVVAFPAALLLARQGRWCGAAVVIGAAVALKPMLVPVLLLFVLARQWRALAWAVGVPVAVSLAAAVALPRPELFFTRTLPFLLHGQDAYARPFDASWPAVLPRLGVPQPLAVTLAALAAVAVLVAARARWRAGETRGCGSWSARRC